MPITGVASSVESPLVRLVRNHPSEGALLPTETVFLKKFFTMPKSTTCII